MATNTTAEQPNKVEIADAGPSRKKIKVEVPAATVDAQLEGQMSTLLMEAELPGFRKGRVPRRLVEKRFGEAVKNQTKEQLIAGALSKAIEDHKLRVLGQPTSETLGKINVEAGKAFAFEVEVEVLPEFTLPALEGIPVKKPLIPVTDEMVAGEVKKLCIQEGRLEERQASEAGDYLTGHAKMTGPDGKTHFESDGIVVQVPPTENKGKGMIVGLAVDDLGKQLGLPKPGASVTVKTKGPENHENEALRGLDLTVTYTPARVDRIIPATPAEVAQKFGLQGEEQMRDLIKQRLNQRVLVDQLTAMRQQVTKHLVEGVTMDLPQRFTGAQAARNFERRRLELMYRGVDPQQIEEHIAELRSSSINSAQADLKIFFILDKAAEQLNVGVSEQEVNGRIAQMAIERNERPERLRQALIQSNQINGIFQQIREHKTLDAIVAKANVSEIPFEDYNKLVREQAGKKA
jgi:trigger factor